MDWSFGKACSHAFVGEVHTEYYADFFAERPQWGSSHYFALPKFDTFDFYDVGMGAGGSSSGAYPNYNRGYGFGSYMYNQWVGNNHYYQDTSVGTMYENSGSTYGYFSETWDSSAGTPT